MADVFEAKVVIAKDGPYFVKGGLPLESETIVTDTLGQSVAWEKTGDIPVSGTYSLCRCGKTKRKPFCDGIHQEIGFDGHEVAQRKPYAEQAVVFEGPELVLLDAERLCSYSRFCDRTGGIWHLTEKSDHAKARRVAIEEARDCPSGRLVLRDKQGKLLEPELAPSISVTEDPKKRCLGPIRLKGGIKLESADGSVWETRNRVTLCRCGQSYNKPFCDGTHIEVRFR